MRTPPAPATKSRPATTRPRQEANRIRIRNRPLRTRNSPRRPTPRRKKKPPNPPPLSSILTASAIAFLRCPSRRGLCRSQGRQDRRHLPRRRPRRRRSFWSKSARTSRGLWRFATDRRKTEEVLNDLDGYTVSFNGEKLVYIQQGQRFVVNGLIIVIAVLYMPRGLLAWRFRRIGPAGEARS